MSQVLLQRLQNSQNRPSPRVILWEPPSLRRPARQSTRRWHVKRLFDVLAVSLAAPVWLPALLLIAIAIKISAPEAPVFFAQRRTGQGGRSFPMIKFRTMYPGADKLKEGVRRLSELPWPDFKVTDDPRVTRLGRFLRRTSFDELPQLLNVLRGEMSFVGPRPTSFSVTTYAHWQMARLEAPPGLTGLWQVDGRGSADFEHRTRQDIDYIRRQSLLLDLKILLRTIGVVVRRKGGY
ncbi:MAG: sugar transferase [Thermoanaerobaculia bacterium]